MLFIYWFSRNYRAGCGLWQFGAHNIKFEILASCKDVLHFFWTLFVVAFFQKIVNYFWCYMKGALKSYWQWRRSILHRGCQFGKK